MNLSNPNIVPLRSPASPDQGYKVMDDVKLMLRIAQGDKTAFTEFTLRHINKILAFALRYMKNRDDADDITQEAFTRLWTKAPQWQPKEAAPHSWLYRITYHLCIDALRKYKTLSNHDSEMILASTDSEIESNQALRQQAVEQALAKLPERQNAAILLCVYQGLSNREAAETMEISVDALESLLSRARRNLREQLMQQEEINS